MRMKFKKIVSSTGKSVMNYIALILENLGDRRAVISVILLLAFLFTFLARIAPMKWGIYLNEFDPYYEYYLAETLLRKGRGDVVKGIMWWFHWWLENPKPRDMLFWAPHGRDIRRTSQPGAAIFSSVVYSVLKLLVPEIDLYTVHAFIPPVGAALAVFFIYLLGKELHSLSAGIISAVLISVSWSFMYRTNFGAKHEGIAIPFMILSFYFFLKAYRKNSILYAVISGLAVGGIVLSWGAYLYPWNLLALIAVVWMLLHPSDTRLVKTYLIENLIAQFFVAIVPRFGPEIAFTSVASILPNIGNIAAILILLGILAPLTSRKTLRKIFPAATLGIAALLLITWQLGFLTSLSGRIMAVVFPLWREVGVTTVAEHAIPTWMMIYNDYQSGILFGLLGMLIYLFKAGRDLRALMISLLFPTALYAASSMARLTLLLAPILAITASIGFTEIIWKLVDLLVWKPSSRLKKSYSKELVVVAIILIIAIFSPSVLSTKSIVNSHQPPLILTSTIPLVRYNYEYMDWISALEWIKENVPKDAVIATWWDYGYWISVNTRRKTTCDNSTLNTKQIQKIAEAFMSPEEKAIEIFRELNASYVVVFEPFQKVYMPYLGINLYFSMLHPALGGDLAKSAMMLRWIGRDPKNYLYGYGTGQYAYIEQRGYKVYILVPKDTPEALNATLYKLLFAKNEKHIAYVHEEILGQKLPMYNGPVYTIEQPKYFELVFVSEPNGWVKVFKINYP